VAEEEAGEKNEEEDGAEEDGALPLSRSLKRNN